MHDLVVIIDADAGIDLGLFVNPLDLYNEIRIASNAYMTDGC